jgi:hypothetical protein
MEINGWVCKGVMERKFVLEVEWSAELSPRS